MIDSAIDTHIRKDPYTGFLGAKVETIELGYCRVSLMITESMVNFHGLTHGGIVFGLGDIALAAASNSHGQTAVAINASISFLRPTRPGDLLVAEAREAQLGGPTALYDITVTEKNSAQLVAKCQATVYRKRESVV